MRLVRVWGLALVALAGVAFLLDWYVKRQITDSHDFRQRADSSRTVSAAMRDTVAQVDSAALPRGEAYVVYRDRIRTLAAPTRREVDTLIIYSDSAIAAERSRVAARDALIRSVELELDIWKRKPDPPRLQVYAEALRDPIAAKWVGRGGADFRIVGALSATAQAELSDRSRVLVGARYTFK